MWSNASTERGDVMRAFDQPQRESYTAVALSAPATRSATDTMSLCLEWAEEHWEVVGVMISMLGALSAAVILAVTFNVVATQLDRSHAPVTSASPVHKEGTTGAVAM